MGEAIDLRCVSGDVVSIVSARRVHTTNLTDHGTWHDTVFFLITSDNTELEIGTAYDLFDFEEVRNAVANKTFLVLDQPMEGRWLEIVALFLTMLKAVPLEEIVKDEREETAGVKKAA